MTCWYHTLQRVGLNTIFRHVSLDVNILASTLYVLASIYNVFKFIA